jgi:hypothetical protein
LELGTAISVHRKALHQADKPIQSNANDFAVRNAGYNHNLLYLLDKNPTTMNEQNLVPLNQRSKSEQRKIQQKGWETSAAVRREKLTMKQQMKRLLELAAKDECGRVRIDPETGEPVSNGLAILLQQMVAALKGDRLAAEFCLKVAGELTDTQQLEVVMPTKTPEERYEEVYGRIEDAELLEPEKE